MAVLVVIEPGLGRAEKPVGWMPHAWQYHSAQQVLQANSQRQTLDPNDQFKQSRQRFEIETRGLSLNPIE
ncbi:hypothetical protein ACOJBM_39995 [Rhizobium beringeri]